MQQLYDSKQIIFKSRQQASKLTSKSHEDERRATFVKRENSEQSQHNRSYSGQQDDSQSPALITAVDGFYANRGNNSAVACFQACRHTLKPDENNIGNFISFLCMQLDNDYTFKKTNIVKHIHELVHFYAQELRRIPDRQINEAKYIATIIHRVSKFFLSKESIEYMSDDITTLLQALTKCNTRPYAKNISNTLYGLARLAEKGVGFKNIESPILMLVTQLADPDECPNKQDIANSIYSLGKLAEYGARFKNIENSIAIIINNVAKLDLIEEQDINNIFTGIGKLSQYGVKLNNINHSIALLINKFVTLDPAEQGISIIIHGLGKLTENNIEFDKVDESIAVLVRKLAAKSDIIPRSIANTFHGLGNLAERGIDFEPIMSDFLELLNKLVEPKSRPNSQDISNTIYSLGKLVASGVKIVNIDYYLEQLFNKLADQPNEQVISNIIYGLAKLAEQGVNLKNFRHKIIALVDLLTVPDMCMTNRGISNVILGLGKITDSGIHLGNIGNRVAILVYSLITATTKPNAQDITNTIYGLGMLVESGIKFNNIDNYIASLFNKLIDPDVYPTQQGIANAFWGLAHFTNINIRSEIVEKLLTRVMSGIHEMSASHLQQICAFLASRKLHIPTDFLKLIKKGVRIQEASPLEVKVQKVLQEILPDCHIEKEKVILFKPVDYYVELNNGERKIIIEIDGPHHDTTKQNNSDAFHQKLFELNGYEVVHVHHREWNNAVDKREYLRAKLYSSSNSHRNNKNSSLLTPSTQLEDEMMAVLTPQPMSSALPVLFVEAKHKSRKRFNKPNANTFHSEEQAATDYQSVLSTINRLSIRGKEQWGDSFQSWYENLFEIKESGKETALVRAQRLYDNGRVDEAIDKLNKVKQMVEEKYNGFALKPPGANTFLSEQSNAAGLSLSLNDEMVLRKRRPGNNVMTTKYGSSITNEFNSKVSRGVSYCWATLMSCCLKKSSTQTVVDNSIVADMKYKKRV